MNPFLVDSENGISYIELYFDFLAREALRLLGLRFIAVMPECTAPGKLREIRALGAECMLVPPGSDCAAIARMRADSEGACFLDQFGLAERATDWRGNNNIAESIVAQLAREPQPVPDWIVCGAGTGGTSATIGRYLRYRRLDTRLCVAEPAGGAYAHGWRHGDRTAASSATTLVEGIGRPRVEPGFLFEVVDEVIEVADADSFAAAWLLEELLGRRYGGSSGTNLVACLQLAAQLHREGRGGCIVTLLCDRGERYAETAFDRPWLQAHGIDVDGALATLRNACAGAATTTLTDHDATA
jgi:cysteine synthase A